MTDKELGQPSGRDGPTVDESIVLTLAQLGAGDAARVGAKAAHLGELMRVGVPVPRGFCLTTAAFERHVAAAGAAPALAELATAEPGAVREDAGKAVRALLMAAPVPLDLAHAIVSTWAQLLRRAPCAVRSSATAEDLPDASFAGQQDTVLNVRDDDALLRAVRECWASLFSDRALTYRAHHGLGRARVAMALIIQELVQADAAGVLFTVNPLSRCADEILVEASYGLGEAVVSGRVTPDRFVLEKTSLRVVERTLGDKRLAFVPAPSGGVREQPIATGAAGAAAVGDRALQRVAALGLQAERLFGGPQDLEWAVAGNDVFVLQSRPITAPALPASPADRQVWTNVNAGEVLPDVVSPLTRSFLERTVIRWFADLIADLGFDLHDAPLIGFVAGRAYFNLTTAVAMVRAVPGGRKVDATAIFGGMHAGPEAAMLEDDLPRVRLSRLQLLQQIPGFILWWLKHDSAARGERARATFARQIDERRRHELARLDEASLLVELDDGVELFRAGVSTLMGYMLASASYFPSLDRLCVRWFPGEPSLANQLLTGVGGMASAEAGLDLWRLAALAHENPAVAGVVLAANGFDEARAGLAALETGTTFLARWEEFLARHGHHARGEVELMNARWADDPDYVLEQVQSYLRTLGGKDPVAVHRAGADARVQCTEAIRRRLRNPVKRAIFNFNLRRAQHGLRYRENAKSEAVRLVARLRQIAVELGRRLAARGVLECPADIFFLHLEELPDVIDGGVRRGSDAVPCQGAVAAEHSRGLADGTNHRDPGTWVVQRRAAFERDRSVVPPPVVVGRFTPETVTAETVDATVDVLTGFGVSPGVVTGPARVILRADADERVLPGEILVAPFTDPGWTPYFQLAAGLVTDLGGLLSHGSIVAREYGLPAVVNVGHATRLIRTGDRLQIDGTRGEVRILR